jgi:hypothetical protein
MHSVGAAMKRAERRREERTKSRTEEERERRTISLIIFQSTKAFTVIRCHRQQQNVRSSYVNGQIFWPHLDRIWIFPSIGRRRGICGQTDGQTDGEV